MRKLATILCLSLVLLGLAGYTYAATSGGSGYDRWVLLADSTGTNYTVEANVTVPETVYDDTPTIFPIEYTITNTGNTTANVFNYTVTITIGDQTASTTTALNVTYNHTVTAEVKFSAFELLNGTNQEGNNTITITLKCGGVQKDTWSGIIKIIRYGAGMDIWIELVPAVISVVVVVKIVQYMKKRLR